MLAADVLVSAGHSARGRRHGTTASESLEVGRPSLTTRARPARLPRATGKCNQGHSRRRGQGRCSRRRDGGVRCLGAAETIGDEELTAGYGWPQRRHGTLPSSPPRVSPNLAACSIDDCARDQDNVQMLDAVSRTTVDSVRLTMKAGGDCGGQSTTDTDGQLRAGSMPPQMARVAAAWQRLHPSEVDP